MFLGFRPTKFHVLISFVLIKNFKKRAKPKKKKKTTCTLNIWQEENFVSRKIFLKFLNLVKGLLPKIS